MPPHRVSSTIANTGTFAESLLGLRSSASSTSVFKMKRAVKLAQNMWRNKLIRRHAAELLKSGVVVGSELKSISFEEACARFSSPSVIAHMKPVVNGVNSLSMFRHGSDGATELNVRVVLYAFLIVNRPVEVFVNDPPDSVIRESLFNAAVPLVEIFGRILPHLAVSGSLNSLPMDLTGGFSVLLAKYIECFSGWNVPQVKEIIDRLKASLTALYDAMEQLPPDELHDSAIRAQLMKSIEMLRAKFNKLKCGQTLARFDAERRASVEAGRTDDEFLHELILDPAFKLTDWGTIYENPVADGIRETFHRVGFLFVYYSSSQF